MTKVTTDGVAIEEITDVEMHNKEMATANEVTDRIRDNVNGALRESHA